MVSTYTPNKNLEKPGNGDYVDTWNVPLNTDMTAIDTAFGGTLNLNATAGNAVLTSTQYTNLIINVTGAMSASVTYTIPSGVGGQWIVRNATTDNVGGPWSVTIASGGGGSSVTVIRGRNTTVWSDGTNIRSSEPNIPSIGTVTSVDVSGGTTGLTTSGGPITSSGTITIAGKLIVANGGTGANTLTGYVKGNGTSAMTASSTVPLGDLSGLGANVSTFLATPTSANLAASVSDETGSGSLVFGTSPTIGSPAITGGTINNTAIGGSTPAAGAFTTLSASSTVSGTGFSTYLASPPAIGGTVPAAGTFTTVTDNIGNVRNVPANTQGGAYVLVASDNGKFINISTGGVTVPSGTFSVGNTITIYNNSASSQTITQGASVTMYLVGTANTGNRTLAQRGLATLICVATNTFVISGGGLS